MPVRKKGSSAPRKRRPQTASRSAAKRARSARGTKSNDPRGATKGAKAKSGGAWDAVLAPRATGEKRYWLVKSEPDTFSFDDLLRSPNRTTKWNGIRNFVARNFLRDGMKLGDRVLYYHSSTEIPGIVGICEVVREAYPDDTAFDPSSEGYDPKSDRSTPTWYMVDLRAVAQLTHPVTLEQIKARPELAGMTILRIGRLSVTPVTAEEWSVITRLADS